MVLADVNLLKDGGGKASIALGGETIDVDMTSVTDEASLTSAINAAANGLGITATHVAGSSITFTGQIAGTSAALAVTGAAAAGTAITGAATAAAATTSDLHADDINISSVTGTADALKVIDQALLEISDSRANLGAVQNRFGHTINNLSNIQENVSASRSRIQDTDFASETAQMTKNQILQQAGTSILAQSNQLPQAALSLI